MTKLLAWIDRQYRLIMLAMMCLEIVLLGVLVFVEVFSVARKCWFLSD